MQGRQLLSTITKNGELILDLTEVEVKKPDAGEVLIKIQATPINPSDMWPMFGPANLAEAKLTNDRLSLVAPVPQEYLPMVNARLDQRLSVGNEGAGKVIEVGDGAEHLLGKVVAFSSGQAYADYCTVPATSCLPHHAETTAEQAAASFVNPLTALGMVETMKLDGHSAIVHTAAASNLGQMLNRLCNAESIPLVNVVRKQQQLELLKSQGAEFVVNTSNDTFHKELFHAIAATKATLAFDATGGGELASTILGTMEMYLSRNAKGLNTYGSEQLKQVYLYGALDVSPTILKRAYGMSWSVGGWLMPHFLNRVGVERVMQLQKKVADEITTTFASHYTDSISLEAMLQPENILAYNAKKTGSKFLVTPNQ